MPQLLIDYSNYPAARYENIRLDVPFGDPTGKQQAFGQLKMALRQFFSEWHQVERASLLWEWRKEYGDQPIIVIAFEPESDINTIGKAWVKHCLRADWKSIAFACGGNGPITTFARLATEPFYVKGETPISPRHNDLITFLYSVPDQPNFDQLFEQLDLADELATWFINMSTHAEAKRTLLGRLYNDEPIALMLRSFDSESIAGKSPLGHGRRWALNRPMPALYREIIPQPHFGVANPLDPFPSADALLLQVGERWQEFIELLLPAAASVFFVCDSLTPGVVKELSCIRRANKEDQTIILIPGEDQQGPYQTLHALTEKPQAKGSVNPLHLRRRLSTFGVASTTEEVSNYLIGQRGPSK